MQLQLIPPAPHHQILFDFALPLLPSTLPLPPAYAAQFQLLLDAEIEPPPSPYALDKAVWAVHLIEVVLFDLVNRQVNVKLIDGAVIGWKMHGEETLLNQVISDIERSGVEAERELREAERKQQEEITAAAAAAAVYLPITQPGSVFDAARYESKSSGGSKPIHRRSRTLFNSLLSALSLNSISEPSTSSSTGHSVEEHGRKNTSSRSLDAKDESKDVSRSICAIPILSTSEYTYPIRDQLPRKGFPVPKFLRRRARSTLIDCFRRWILPEVREHLKWGAFPPFDDMPDIHGDPVAEGEGMKWGRMSKATNAYADWACRSMISRCERALRSANAQVEGVASLVQRATLEGGEAAEKESRRSSASSTLASAVSASSRASSSAEQIYSRNSAEFDGNSPVSQNAQQLQAPAQVIASTKAAKRTSASARHITTLRSALDRFKNIHQVLALEAIGLADSHALAMQMLEARGRRKAWSSSEGGGLCRPSPLGAAPLVASPLWLSSARTKKSTTFPLEYAYGSGNSIWELSIPLVRSTLGEISETWEDWQMEWEMEKEFGSEIGFDDDDEFPGVISDFDTSGDSFSAANRSKTKRRSGSSNIYDEDAMEFAHSGFSDSSSSEDEMGASDSDDVSGRTPSPTSPSELLDPNPDGTPREARRGRRAGVRARIGKYEDVRDELPPDPPLMALSPPPRGKFAASRRPESGGGEISSPTAHNDFEGGTLRPPRAARPSRLQVPLADAIPPQHRREAVTGGYPALVRSRLDDNGARAFDEWDAVEDDDVIFGCLSSFKPHVKNHTALMSNRGVDSAKAFQIFDGLGILEQVGGSAEATGKFTGPGCAQNGVGVGHPPGLHGDLPSPPTSPKKWTTSPPESPRRVSHYISRELPPTNEDTSANVPHTPPLVMAKDPKRLGRHGPRLTLAFPDPPSYNPSELPIEFTALCCTRPYQSTDDLLEGAAHVGCPTDRNPSDATILEAGRTCLSKPEEEASALLLNTPTAEHPSSSYPYKWDVNILPTGVKVIGTVGVVSVSSFNETVTEAPTIADTSERVASSPATGPLNAVAKVLSKVRKVKPVLYVTPPPAASSLENTQEGQQPRRLVKLNRSRSWRDLSVDGGLNPKADKKKRRKSADSAPTSPSRVDVTPASESQKEKGGEAVVLEESPCLSSERVGDDLISPVPAISSVQSEIESGWSTPSLVSSPSSVASSPFNSFNSTALDIASEGSPLAETDPNGRGDAYDGIVMSSCARHPLGPAIGSGGEKYFIPEGWFPKSTEEHGSTDGATSSPTRVYSAGDPDPLRKEPTTGSCSTAGPGPTGPRKLQRAQSATRSDATARPPPPPRPMKSLKRSLSLNHFGRKPEVGVSAND